VAGDGLDGDGAAKAVAGGLDVAGLGESENEALLLLKAP
jgi:hypothetical protein